MDESCFSIVLDTSSKDSRGHYLQFSIDICESYERTQKKSIILTSNRALQDWFQARRLKFVNLEFVNAERELGIFSELESVLDVYAYNASKPRHLFILRGKEISAGQLSLLGKVLLKHHDLHVEVLVNASGIISRSKEATSEILVIKKFTELNSRVNFLAWDKRLAVVSDLKNFRFLPEPKNRTPRSSIPTKTVIGFYGKLSFDRGLFDFLFSVFFNPKLHYRISGYGFSRKHLYRSRNFISMRQTPFRGILSVALNYLVQLAFLSRRVKFSQTYFKDEKDMISDMQSCSAVFFSCARSPYSSGLVYQSLAAGIPVVWNPGNSAMAYVLEESFPAGRISVTKLHHFNDLYNLVKEVKGLRTFPIFDYKNFDDVLSTCSFT
jgi:hypothetical protein